ncbi:MAG: hypothetical protein ACK5MG_03910 [Bacteroidales bacterium]
MYSSFAGGEFLNTDCFNTFGNMISEVIEDGKLELTAAYLGDFNLPAVSGEAMYDNSVNAIVKDGRVVMTE